MILTVEPFDTTAGTQPPKCGNAYCLATPIWRIVANLGEHDDVEHVCGSHLMGYVNTAVDNMRIRRK